MNRLRAAVLLAVVQIGGAGCASERTTQPATPPVTGMSSTESVKAKIPNADAQKRITEVENSKTIPESAKPGIIANIRHDAGLQ